MRSRGRLAGAIGTILALAAGTIPAMAQVADDRTSNMTYEGTSVKQGTTNSDLAFWGNRAYAANYDGFRIIDITDPTEIEDPSNVLTDFNCPGPQNDISVWGSDPKGPAQWLFLSVETPRFSATGDPRVCGAGPLPSGFTPEQNASAFEGMRIFDISDERNPVQIATVPTDCGSHTHTLIPGDDGNVYIYVSSYPTSGRTDGIPADPARTPARGANERNDGTACVQPHNKISIIRVPLNDPASAGTRAADGTYPNVKEVSLPARQNAVTSLPQGPQTIHFRGCHDISAFMDLERAFGACWREGLMWNIADPWTPLYLRGMTSLDVDLLFHSVTVSWDGKVLAFEDESGGGGADRCHLEDGKPDRQGAMLFYDRQLNPLGYFKIPREVTRECTAHNYNVIPLTNGRYVLVSAWYTGGTSVIDFTDTRDVEAPYWGPIGKEIGYYVAHEAPNGTGAPASSDVWSSYWYNGYIYANDGLIRGNESQPGLGERGLDVFSLSGRASRGAQTWDFLNPQTQMDLIPQDYRVKSTVTLANDGRFVGKVSAWHEGCEDTRRVKVKRYRPGKADRTVGTTTTKRDGSFVLRSPAARGTFYAVAVPKSFSDTTNSVECRSARSHRVAF